MLISTSQSILVRFATQKRKRDAQVYCPHAIARTGMFGVQYSMILMMAVAYVGAWRNYVFLSGTEHWPEAKREAKTF